MTPCATPPSGACSAWTMSHPTHNSFMRQNERNPSRTRNPRGKSLAVECHDGLARITLEELAITHFVKHGTLQNACTTRPRVVVGLERSAHSHIVRLMNKPTKRSKTNDNKSNCGYIEEGKLARKENLSPMDVTIDRRNLGKEVIRNWDKIHLNVSFLMHDNWVAYSRT